MSHGHELHRSAAPQPTAAPGKRRAVRQQRRATATAASMRGECRTVAAGFKRYIVSEAGRLPSRSFDASRQASGPVRPMVSTGAAAILAQAMLSWSSSVVQANCRTRFTAADFDFIVRALSQSRRESVSLVSLLTDADTRDTLLDQPALSAAILSPNSHLAISPQFYFYVLTRHVLRNAGIDDRPLCDYLASLLDEFTRTAAPAQPGVGGQRDRCAPLPFRPARRLAAGEPGAGVFPAGAAGRLHALFDRHLPGEHRATPLAPGRTGLLVLRGSGPGELPGRGGARGRATPRVDRRIQWPSRTVPRGPPGAQPVGGSLLNLGDDSATTHAGLASLDECFPLQRNPASVRTDVCHRRHQPSKTASSTANAAGSFPARRGRRRAN